MQILDSRGSGEQGLSPPGKAFIDAIGARLPDGLHAAWQNPYPAVSVPWHLPSYRRSVSEGELDLTVELERLRRDCHAGSQAIIVGLSQGAQVTGDVVNKLPGSERNKLLGAVLFGDPRYNHRSFADVLNLDLNGILGSRKEFPADMRGRVLSFCHPLDPVCQIAVSRSTAAHKTYARLGEPEAAVKYFADRIDLGSAKAFEVAVFGRNELVRNDINPVAYRVGALTPGHLAARFGLDVSLADADRVFGGDDHCHFLKLRSDGVASWPAFGLSAEYKNLEVLQHSNGSVCTTKGKARLDYVIATGRYWHTDRGLRIGDSQARVLALYPDAVPLGPGTGELPQPGARGFGLHQRHLPWDVNTYVPDVAVSIDRDVVSSIVVAPDAAGD